MLCTGCQRNVKRDERVHCQVCNLAVCADCEAKAKELAPENEKRVLCPACAAFAKRKPR